MFSKVRGGGKRMEKVVPLNKARKEEKDHSGVRVSMSNGKWIWLCKFSVDTNTRQGEPSTYLTLREEQFQCLPHNNVQIQQKLSQYPATRSWSESSVPFLSLWFGGADGSLDLCTQLKLYYANDALLSTAHYQCAHPRWLHQPPALGWRTCNLTKAEGLVYFLETVILLGTSLYCNLDGHFSRKKIF